MFEPLILEVYDDMQDDYEAQVESYKSEGMSSNDAEDRAYTRSYFQDIPKKWEPSMLDGGNSCTQPR